LGTDDLAQQAGEQLVGAFGAPGAADVGVEPIEQTRPTGPVTPLELVEDEAGILEHGQVLAHGVVVEADKRGQLGNTDRAPSVRDVTEDSMARRISEGAGFPLKAAKHGTVHTPVSHL
jgi:hypothetical protein